MSLLEVRSLTKCFSQGQSQVHALRQVDLTVARGEFAALVGPSGSGKTTLLNLIGALDVPTSGEVWVNGTSLSSLSARERALFRLTQLGFVFQAYNLVPVLSALENVELILILRGVSAKRAREQSKQYLAWVGLSEVGHRRPGALSGGQQQRVAVARALAAEPALVLADEPTANLDAANATGLLDIMHELCREQNTTFLFSTHDPRVMARAERIITLEDGAIVSDVLQTAASERVPA
jgi:putative ABC transport system ATP-binding protein